MEESNPNINSSQNPVQPSRIARDYSKQLAELRSQAIECLDHMSNLDPTNGLDSFKGFELTQRLQAQIYSLFLKFFSPNIPNNLSPANEDQDKSQEVQDSNQAQTEKERKIKLSIQVIRKPPKKKWFSSEIRSYRRKCLALKNSNSYILGPIEDIITVVENGVEIYSGQIGPYPILRGITYVQSLDCYLLNLNTKIQRKDIDDQPPYDFFTMDSHIFFDTLRVSNHNNSLITSFDGKNIVSIDLETKEAEFEVSNRIAGSIDHLEVFGEHEDQVLASTKDGYVLLCKLDFEKKYGFVSSYVNLKAKVDRHNHAPLISIDAQTGYALAENRLCITALGRSSVLSVLKIEKNALVKKTRLEKLKKLNKNPENSFVFGCCSHPQKRIIWVGFSPGDQRKVHLYLYDIETNTLRKSEESSFDHSERYPKKILQIGEDFYYTGGFGSVLKMSVKF